MISTYPVLVFFFFSLSWGPLFRALSPIRSFQISSVLKMCVSAESHLVTEIISLFFAFLLITAKKWTHEYLLSKKFQNWELLFTFKHHQMLNIPMRMNFPNSVFPGSSWPYSRSSFAYLSRVSLLWFLFWTWLSSQLTQILHNKITLFTTSSFSHGSWWSFFFLPSAPFL